MAIYHCSVKNISRSGGKSAVASASYRAGEKLEDLETGITHDYTKKREVVYSEIFLCENAPREYHDRATLWNSVQEIEKASDSRLAREWEVALPNELTLEQSKELIKEYAQSLASEGMCVDANIHWKDGNHHAHIMGTTRAIKENGEWAPKTRKVYELDENGEKIPLIDKKTGLQKVDKQNRKQWKTHKDDFTDWNQKYKVEEWRERWANECNKALEKAQSLERVDHRSFKDRGIERIPTIHEGHVAREMEQKGEVSERCEINRDIKAANMELQALESQQNFFVRMLQHLREKVEALKEQARIEREAKINERLQQLNSRRTVDESARGNAIGDRELSNTDREPQRGSVEERLSALRSHRASREPEQETESTVGELLRTIETERSTQQSEERQSAEVRDYKVSEREVRESERSRLNLERERKAREEQRRAEKEREASTRRSQRHNFHR